MKIKIIFLLSLFLFAQFAAINIFAEDGGATARGVFSLLPTSIFENSSNGLSDVEKQDLLINGKSEFWEIARETPDAMIFVSLPMRDFSIGLRIFRNNVDGSTEAAIGTLAEPVCSLELWRLDTGGGIIPVDTPDEPNINEFFTKKHKRSKRINNSVLICLDDKGLKAVPIFWNKTGMLASHVDNDINFQWNGNGFDKTIHPSQALKPAFLP